MATKESAGKKKAANGKRPKGKLDIGSDPPIIVGGGGSTYIWIKKDTNPELVDPATLGANDPDPDTRPVTPGLYYLFHLPRFNVRAVHANDGDGTGNHDHGPPAGNQNAQKKHRTFFD